MVVKVSSISLTYGYPKNHQRTSGCLFSCSEYKALRTNEWLKYNICHIQFISNKYYVNFNRRMTR